MTCRRSPPSAARGLRIASVALLIAVLAAGGLIAAYLVHVGGSGDASRRRPHDQADDAPRGHVPVDRRRPTLTPVKLADASSYDPQGDGSEGQYLAPTGSTGTRRRPGGPRPTRGR